MKGLSIVPRPTPEIDDALGTPESVVQARPVEVVASKPSVGLRCTKLMKHNYGTEKCAQSANECEVSGHSYSARAVAVQVPSEAGGKTRLQGESARMNSVVNIRDAAAPAMRCLPCLRKGHTCYADRINDRTGEATCIYCLDEEPCFWERRNKRTAKEEPVHQPSIATVKVNGHEPRLCKCGCGEVVPAANRFQFVKGHKHYKRRAKANGRMKQAMASSRGTAAVTTPTHPLQTVSLEVTEAQLDRFFCRLPLEHKQQVINQYLREIAA